MSDERCCGEREDSEVHNPFNHMAFNHPFRPQPTPPTDEALRRVDEWVPQLLDMVNRALWFLAEHGASDIFQFDPIEAIQTLALDAARPAALDVERLARALFDDRKSNDPFGSAAYFSAKAARIAAAYAEDRT